MWIPRCAGALLNGGGDLEYLYQAISQDMAQLKVACIDILETVDQQ